MRFFTTGFLLTLTFFSSFAASNPVGFGGVTVTAEDNSGYWLPRANVSSTNLQTAIARVKATRGSGAVYLPEGTFTNFPTKVYLTNGVDIIGQGSGRTIIDASTHGPTDELFFGGGSITALPAITVAVDRGATNITFASAHGMQEGDIFTLHNPTDSSFSASRTYYEDGEYFQVSSVTSSTVVTVTQPAYSSYGTSGTLAWFVNGISCRIKGVTIKFKRGLGAGQSGIQIQFGNGVVLEDVDMDGSQYAMVFLDRSYDTTFNSCRFNDKQATIGNNYGILVGNSQRGRIINCSGQTTRHCISFGGSSGVDMIVPNRDWQIIGGHYPSIGTAWAIDVHGNTEHYSFIGVDAPGGVAVGGDNGTIVGGRFGNFNANGTAIVVTEPVGMNFNIGGGARVYALRSFDNGLISLFTRPSVARKSTLNVNGVTIDPGSFAASTYPSGNSDGILFGSTEGAPAESDITFNLQGVTFRTDKTDAHAMWAIRHVSTTTYGIENIVIDNLVSAGGGIRLCSNAKRVLVQDSIIRNALQYGIYVADLGDAISFADQQWSFQKNTVLNSKLHGIYFTGSPTNHQVQLLANTSINNGQGAASYSIVVDGATNAWLVGNNVGDIQATTTQTGTYSVLNTSNLVAHRNINLGKTLTFSHAASVSSVRDDPPVWGVNYDYANNGVMIGSAATTTGSYATQFIGRRDTNAFVQYLIQNRVAAGNTGAGVGWSAQGGADGNSASGFLGAFAQDYSPSRRAGKFGMIANSDSDAMILEAITSGQTIDFYAGGATLGLQLASTNAALSGNLAANGVTSTNGLTVVNSGQFDSDATAGNTRFLIYDVDNGTLERVSVGAADSAGSGYKVLRINN